MDVQGCPRYGYLYEGKKPHWGLAIDHCCHCHNIIVSTPASLSINAPSLSSTVCVDTSGWENRLSYGCDWYERENEPGCTQDGNSYWYECDETGCTQGKNSLGEMGSAIEHCCYCGGGSHTCEDVRSRCQNFFDSNVGEKAIPVCEEAASCSCEDTVHIITNRYDYDNETFGLYNACKCDFWSRLCEDSGVGEACDYAAEYCCGDYLHGESVEGSYYLDSYRIGFNYLNSPTCYCDFFNYAQNEFGHTLKSKALNISNEFSNPCGQLEDAWFVSLNIGPYESYTNSDLNHNDVLKRPEFERPSLEAIYKGTNGQNWKVNDGWMNETDHCQWYGISCDNDGLVKSINLRDNNLAGQFPVYSHKVLERGENLIIGNVWLHTKYGLANLYSLKTLDLADNKLTGTIDYRPLYNLPSLSHFDVSANQLSGEMDALIAPSLTHADFSNNRFTSIRRFEKYKGSLQTLRFCDVSNNFIQIDATDLLKNAPPNIEQFFASNNKIHGSLPELLNNLPKLRRFNMSSNALSGSLPEWFNNLPALRQFDMSSNTLSGELPDFADSILSMQELDLSNQKNGFTGSIPEDLWRLQSLKVLNLAGNTLAGTISPDIGKMAALEVFDLSNNLLSSSIPSELGMLEGTLKRLRLANNTLSGTIPSQLDEKGNGCDWYEGIYNPGGCPDSEDEGKATLHCCYCDGGSHTLPPTISPKPPSSATISANPTQPCFDTPGWQTAYGYGCNEFKIPGAPESVRCPTGGFYAGVTGSVKDNCCHCGGGSHTPPPINSPTMSANPTQFCLNTPNWKDKNGRGCDSYEDYQKRGCPNTDQYGGDMGLATTNCCHCGGGSHTLPPTTTISLEPSSSLTISANPTQFCLDTPGWTDSGGDGCDWYRDINEGVAPGCPEEWGHCCHCGGGIRTCEDYRSKCQDYFVTLGIKDGVMSSLCREAESCSCNDVDHDDDDEIVTEVQRSSNEDHVRLSYISISKQYRETVGLYNECKCNFWLPLCEDTGVGEACDYAAEYCCGDYNYQYLERGRSIDEGFEYKNSPTCYCDFFNYAKNEFGHTLKPKALNMSRVRVFEFKNPCGQLEDYWATNSTHEHEVEVASLEAIYERTNGQNWTNSAGWMNETVDHCQWYGISCDGNGQVISINLRDNNLAGQFPVYTRSDYRGRPVRESIWEYTKYGLANLRKLKTLDLADNKLTGTIEYPPLYNLQSLTHFDISGNQLSGEVNALVTPSLTYANFSNNQFTSKRRFDIYKVSPLQTLSFCDVSNNAIQNDVSDLLKNIPPNIERFFASNNQIYGSLPTSFNNLPKLRQFDMSSNKLSGSLPEWFNNLPELRQFDMSSNALSGELPDFADSIFVLQELDLSNQTIGFMGSIPEDLWRFQSLMILNLAGNKLAGTIPPTIGNMAVLEVFDLSDNLLSGTIPSELGVLDGTLKRLGLANNRLYGTIPSEIGQLQGAFIILEGNHFHNKTSAPLSLCMLSSVEAFDIANDTTFCQIERNALSDFYDSAKGAEWTDGSLWLDEYASYCAWNGVTCDEEMNHVKKLQLSNNGLSGRLSERIGDLAFIEVLDLSDNDIKGSIPTEISLLSDLTYLRLSYNAFTGTAEGVGKLTKLQLLQLQSNRITEMPNMTQLQLDDKKYRNSTFVTDCGVPSAFDEAPKCKNCTMCCNANDDCYPQEVTPFEKMGLSYITFPAVFFVSFIVICCMVGLSLYLVGKRKNRGNDDLTMSAERRLEEDDNYALSRIGKDSVYSYFVTDMVYGWIVAFATLGIQVGILAVFIKASEAKLQEDTIDIQFTWKCPRDSDVCKNTADLTDAAWFIFSMLMVAFLAKDMINGSKLLYHSSESRHNLGPRIRYFIGGITVYNKAIATSNTDIIVNSVIVLFIMEIDEYIFAALEASNKKWTAHAAESDDSSLVREVSGMKEEFERQRAQIESQQEQIDNQQEQINNQQKELKMLREMVEKIQQSQAAAAAAAAATTTTTTTPESESAGVACEGSTNVQVQQMEQVDQIAMPCEAEENTQESKEADEVAATSDLLCERDTDEALQE